MDTQVRAVEGGEAPVLDTAEVARLLRLNVDYVRKLSREGVLPAHKLPGGRTFRYLRTEVLDWLGRQPGVAESGDPIPRT